MKLIKRFITKQHFSMDGYKPADRLHGIDQPRVWSVLTPLSQELKAANLVSFLLPQGQGFPTWKPPQFYLEYLKGQVDEGKVYVN
jgi:hypothetical protein